VIPEPAGAVPSPIADFRRGQKARTGGNRPSMSLTEIRVHPGSGVPPPRRAAGAMLRKKIVCEDRHGRFRTTLVR